MVQTVGGRILCILVYKTRPTIFLSQHIRAYPALFLSTKTETYVGLVYRGRRGRDRMVVGFTTTISNYHWHCNQRRSPLTLRVRILLRQGFFDTTLCDKVRQ